MNVIRPLHREILQILQKFDAEYFAANNVLFGGGTRIAIELQEYRESVDVDFFCSDSTAYKAVRGQVTNDSLGCLLRPGHSLDLVREIRVDRDAVRLFASTNERPVKIEFIHFENYPLQKECERELFPIAYTDRTTCYFTKLLANADRYAEPDKKDLLDLCMMVNCWGPIPADAWQVADEKYGAEVIKRGLVLGVDQIQQNSEETKSIAINHLQIAPEIAEKLVGEYLQVFSQEVAKY